MNIYDGIGADNLVRVNCPFCGSTDAVPVRAIADIALCSACGAIYLRTRLSDSALGHLYQSYAETGSHMDPPKIQADLLNSPLRRDDFLAELLKHVKPPASLLDIGCGWGAFIQNASGRGFLARGIEITAKSADFGRDKLGLDIDSRPFAEIEYQPDSFNAVSMIHSLEHLTEPVKVIRKIYNILKPEGILFGAVPNFKSFASDTLGDRWEWIDPYHHIIHYYPEFLRHFLTLEGFDILKLETITGDFNRIMIGDTVRKAFGLNTERDISLKIKELENSLKGEEIRFIARKKKEMAGKENKTESSYMDNFKKIEITIHRGDDYEAIIHKALLSVNEPVHPVIYDPDNFLPKSCDNWNGVTLIRGSRPARDMEAIEARGETTPGTPVADEAQPMNKIRYKSDITGGFSNKKAYGKLPFPLPKPLALNLGCGKDVKDGFINIDLFSDNPFVVGMDVRKLELPDNSADFILASDILEHFPHREIDSILKEWARVLKPESELMIRCPSLKLQAEAYLSGVWNADIASYMIFGGQTNPGDYHCVGFDEKSIVVHLENAGMDVIEILEHKLPQTKGFINLNMTVRAKKRAVSPKSHDYDYAKDIFGAKEIVQPLQSTGDNKKNDNQTEISAFDFSNGAEPALVSEEKYEIKPQINVVWEGSQFVYHSLALINRELCYNIIKSGTAEVTIVPYENDGFEPGGNPKYNLLRSHDIRFREEAAPDIQKLPYAWIRHQWPPKEEPPRGAKWIIMQPWEFSTHRKDFVEIFKNAEEIWTPSTYSRQSFINSGVEFNKVQVIPNGIEPELFTPLGDTYPLRTKKKFRLLFVGGTIFRKGIDILLNAYKKAFNANDNICLVIKDMGGESFYKGQNAKEYIQKLKLDPKNPEIEYIDTYLDEPQMASLYRACDVFACPYRGEGFSLPALEAMACGLPVVVTEGGATEDFVTDSCGWKIPAAGKSIGDKIDDKPLTGEAFLLEPDENHLSELLRSIYADPSDVFIKGIKASYTARTIWTWERASVKALARLDYMFGTDMAKTAAIAILPSEDAAILLGAADDAFEAGKYADSAKLYNDSIAFGGLKPKHTVYALNKAALCFYYLNEYENTDKYLAKALAVTPGNPDSLYMQALISAEKGDWDSSLEILSPLMDNWVAVKYDSRLGFGLDSLLVLTAKGLNELGDPENSLKLFGEALKINPNNYEACYGAALRLKETGAADSAREMLEWAIKLNPGYEEAINELQNPEN